MTTKCVTKVMALQLVLALSLTVISLAQQDTQPSSIVGLSPDHATLSVGDIHKESAWYQRVLGFKLSQDSVNDQGALFQMLTIPGYRLDLLEYKGSARAVYASPRYLTQGWVHLVFNLPDINAAYKSLRASGVDVTATMGPKGNVDHLILRDPEGNQFELFQRP